MKIKALLLVGLLVAVATGAFVGIPMLCSAEAVDAGTNTLVAAADTTTDSSSGAEFTILDSHADTPLCFMRGSYFSDDNPKVQVTLPRMRKGGVKAQYLACWVAQGKLTESGRKAARERIDTLIGLCHEQVAADNTACALALTADDVRRINADGRIAILIGVENGYGIGLDLDVLNSYKERGVTYVTLCHSYNNDICDSSSDKSGPRHHGLSEFGYKVVERMNNLGLVIDLSHASEETFYDVLKASKAPVVCTHSGAAGVFRHDRNLTDEQLRALAAAGGVAQICAVDEFLAQNPKNATFDDFMQHILHAIEIAGVDHVGIGTDFDGGGGVPGFNSSDDFPQVIASLRAHNFTDADIAKIMGGNYLRVLKQVQTGS